MAEFLRAKGVDRLDLKRFLLEQAERLKKHPPPSSDGSLAFPGCPGGSRGCCEDAEGS
jgi:hypothetical protein